MYTLTTNDTLQKIEEIPQSDVGAPCPMLLCNERRLSLCYLLSDVDPSWDGTSVRVVDENSEGKVIIVQFEGLYAHMFGPPNDEAIQGHPLYSKGLQSYSYFKVKNSSWIAKCIEMNSVHRMHKDEAFSSLNHYIFSFHDSVFECLANSYRFSVFRDSIANVLFAQKIHFIS